MKVDIFKREETNEDYTYLAVPHGKDIPQEATNTDWFLSSENTYIGQDNDGMEGLDGPDALHQIQEKGYAITNMKDKVRIGSSAV